MRLPRSAARYAAVLLTAAALAGCNQANDEAGQTANETATPPSAPTPAPTNTSEESPTAASPADSGPARLIPEAEKGEAGARNVLLDFARAIEFEDFSKAYAMLDKSARQKITHDAFAAMFEGFGEITVAVPFGRMEGAAGSLYYEVPTRITGSSGKKLSGTTVLRRVNDVPGATAEQLRWHIESFEVEPD